MSKRPLREAESSVDTGRVFMPPSQTQHFTREMALVRARNGGVFECKTCGRRFPTYQALGGHRASHRRRPGRPRAHEHGDDDGSPCARHCRLEMQGNTVRTNRVHGCPVCGVEFAVGQALGGHMKRHRATGDAHEHSAGEATSVKADSAEHECTGEICLDLNLSQAGKCAKCRNEAPRAAAKVTLQFSD